MSDKLYEKKDLLWTDSDYLCLFCYELLYVVPELRATRRPSAEGWQPGTEVCANPSCLYSHHMLCSKDSVQDNYRPDFDDAMKKFYGFDQGLALRTLYSRRADALRNFPTMNPLELSAADHILIDAMKRRDWGSGTDASACARAIGTCVDRYSKLEFFGTVDEKNNLTDGVRPYVMKYIYVIAESLKEIGLADPTKHRPGEAGLYHGLEDQARAENAGWRDYGDAFQHPSATTCINRAFNLFSIVRNMHQYPATRSDLVALHSFLQMCDGSQRYALTESELRRAYKEAMRENGMKADFDSLLKSYASGQTCAPVFVYDGQRYWFDRVTLQAFISYIEPLNCADGSKSMSGHQVVCEQANDMGGVFERWVRDKFRKEGWDVLPEEGRKLKIGPEKREYDCVAVDRVSKTIVVGEAKFENMPPSTMSANKVVDRLALDKKSGLLRHAKSHDEKSNLFRRYLYAGKLGSVKPPRGSRHRRGRRGRPYAGKLEFAKPWEYRVVPVVVTKHAPLIKKHLTVHLMSYPEFNAFDFKTGG